MNSIFLVPPPDFQPSLTAAGCYCAFENKILLLKRHPSKPQGHTWGIPGGKINKGETPRRAVIREVREEIGILLPEDDLEELDKMYVRRPSLDYIFYQFRKRFLTLPSLVLGLEEHVEAVWIALAEALKLPLIYGGKEALLSYQQSIKKREPIGE